MPVELPLESMTFADKLHAMELLWADLSKHSDALPSPGWHQEILKERRQGAVEGTLKFLDWNTAMTQLRRELHGSPSP